MSKPLVLRLQHAVCSSQLDPDTRHLVMVMALMADGKTGTGFASQATIAKAMGRSVRHVGETVRGLEASTTSAVGIRRRRRGSAKGRSSDQYELFFRQQEPGADSAAGLQEERRADSDHQIQQEPCADSVATQEAPFALSVVDPTGTPQQPNRHATTPEEAQRADDQRFVSASISDHSAPRSRKRGKASPKEPLAGAHDLKLHYVAEFERHRGIKPAFSEKTWGRAMKSFGELATTHGLEASKGIISRALVPSQFVHRIQPWELSADANKWLAPVPTRAGLVQRGGSPRESEADYLKGFDLEDACP